MCRGTTASHALASGFWVHRQTDRHVLTVLVHVLDATRHPRKQEALYAFPCCSPHAQRLTASENPAGEGQAPLGLRLRLVLNALRHQRIQQTATRSYWIRLTSMCSTPYGIRESSRRTGCHHRGFRRVLNALRHQRIQQKENLKPEHAEVMCSTPYGIRESSSGPREPGRQRDRVLNALRHQRIQQSGGPASASLWASCAQRLTASENPAAVDRQVGAAAVRQCSTPYGIRESSSQRCGGEPRPCCWVLNALRHQRIQQLDLIVSCQRTLLCSTPYGIRESSSLVWRRSRACTTWGAQRLTASENPAADWRIFNLTNIRLRAQRLTASENPAGWDR